MRAAGAGLLIVAALAGCGGGSGEPVAAEDARRCLSEGGGLKVQGPLKREADDVDAPDSTLVVTGRETFVYLGWYDDEARGRRSAAEQREHAKDFDGSVERHGRLTIIWVRGRDSDEASRIERCALA